MEPQDQEIGECYVAQETSCTDFEAPRVGRVAVERHRTGGSDEEEQFFSSLVVLARRRTQYISPVGRLALPAEMPAAAVAAAAAARIFLKVWKESLVNSGDRQTASPDWMDKQMRQTDGHTSRGRQINWLTLR